ncbi:MAG: Crp/Fnr family transcriptional regulator [Marinilabiliales bacterium]|nr:MAG: Crp/Fnr family transcriptional regulator [Marinilabiliales bacterium]
MFNKFINQIKEQGDLNEAEIAYLKEHAKIVICKRHEEIISAGKMVKDIYFVIDGCVRMFYNVDGNHKTAFFYNSGDFIWTGRDANSPIQKNYETIEDTVLVKINKQIVYDLMESSANLESIIRYYKERELIAYQHLIAHFITLSPEERFLHLVENNKALVQRVPQQYIASYLGVSAETLSRIKRRVYEKEKEAMLMSTF